jgi:polar amino acid transport system substrate-binding protein
MALALIMTACSAEDSAGQTSKEPVVTGLQRDNAAYDLLPQQIKDAGTLKVVNAFDYPPHAFLTEDNAYDGIDYDIVEALGPVLGVKVEWQRSIGFATLIPAVQSGKADMAIESIAVTPERLTNVSFVEYFKIQNSLAVAKGNPRKLDPTNLCGHSISAEGGTFQVKLLNEKSAECTTAGKEPVTIQTFPSYAPMILAVQTGQVDGAAAGTSATAYQVKQSNGAIEDAGIIPGSETIAGIAVAKGNDQLGEAITQALTTMQSDGTMNQVLAKWDVTSSAQPAVYKKATG